MCVFGGGLRALSGRSADVLHHAESLAPGGGRPKTPTRRRGRLLGWVGVTHVRRHHCITTAAAEGICTRVGSEVSPSPKMNTF